MRLLTLLILDYCTLATSLLFPWVPLGVIGSRGGYTFELHDHHHLLLVRGRHDCYFIRLTNNIHNNLASKSSVIQMQDEILKLIQQHHGLTKTSVVSVSLTYRDAMAVAECVMRDLYLLDYHPPVIKHNHPMDYTWSFVRSWGLHGPLPT